MTKCTPKTRLLQLFFLFTLMTASSSLTEAKVRKVRLRWLHTSDMHSALFGHDYLQRQDVSGSLASCYQLVDHFRRQYGDRLIMTDGGDNLQGQPLAYYYNYVNTTDTHLVAQAMNAVGYDAAVLGNHDIETGHAVFDRYVAQCQFPFLGANIIDTQTGRPYHTPYIIMERAGIRIAILGMTSPAVPNWLPQSLWSGMRFDDIVESSRRWVEEIRREHKPHLMVGLFHSGWDEGIVTADYRENAVREVAQNVPGFDLIFYGHDHRARAETIRNCEGGEVLCIAPEANGKRICHAMIDLWLKDDTIVRRSIKGTATHPNRHRADVIEGFKSQFAKQKSEVEAWIHRPIGQLTQTIAERDAYFGPSHFIDLIHQMQLRLTGADISLAAPVSGNADIPEGELRVSHMFSLYKYENFLYKMRMTGREIHGLLEMSYGLWTNQMTSPEDHALLIDDHLYDHNCAGMPNPCYNMDAAAGIVYDVDLTKPAGERVTIKALSDGRPFCMDSCYTVATNSYRGNGGGELMTRGAGIPHGELASRILWSSDKDLRYYLIEEVEKQGTIQPTIISQWRFVPEAWTTEALRRDRQLLYGKREKKQTKQ